MKGLRILPKLFHFLIICAIASGFLTLTQIFSCSSNPPSSVSAQGKKTTPTKPNTKAQGEEVAALETNHGRIVLKFYPEVAPNHVANFKQLARSGFYDGSTFHRVIPGFMIQGGDPLSKDDNRANDGTGGSGKNLKAEFNSKSHVRGALSMARSRHPDSASSQFFICVAPAPHLNNQYTLFGMVTEGMDVVDKIVNLPKDARNNPLTPAIIKKATIENKKG